MRIINNDQAVFGMKLTVNGVEKPIEQVFSKLGSVVIEKAKATPGECNLHIKGRSVIAHASAVVEGRSHLAIMGGHAQGTIPRWFERPKQLKLHNIVLEAYENLRRSAAINGRPNLTDMEPDITRLKDHPQYLSIE